MQYTEQPTPPYNSLYQTYTSREDFLLETPYLSPSRHGSMSRYLQDLGLYNDHHQAPTALPPSPASSELWSGHVSTGASPLMPRAIAGLYASEAFKHPIIRSLQPWEGSKLSSQSSFSSTTIVPVHSHGGFDHTYNELNRQMTTVSLGSRGWDHDAPYVDNKASLPWSGHYALAVTPSSTIVPYGNHYGATQVVKMDPIPALKYEKETHFQASSERSSVSRPEYHQASARRQRVHSRRHTSPTTAAFVCQSCTIPKGFARRYNLKQHMKTHRANRPRPNVCFYQNCQKAFVRHTDLIRHQISVHSKDKDWKCDRCTAKFARKDTCGRHMTNGCPKNKQSICWEIYAGRL